MILSPLSDGSGSECVFIECVYHFKLLGINISHDMNWQAHTLMQYLIKLQADFISLGYRKSLFLNPHHLLHFYLTVIRHVLEYCSVVWHDARFYKSSVRDLGGHTTPSTSYYLSTNHRHARYLCALSSEIAFSPRSS